MPQTAKRNRIPRRSPGAPRDWTRLDAHERAVLGVLYRNGFPMTFHDLLFETGLGKARLTATLTSLASPSRCAALGDVGVAIERHDRPAADPTAPPFAPLYIVQSPWLNAHGPDRLRSAARP